MFALLPTESVEFEIHEKNSQETLSSGTSNVTAIHLTKTKTLTADAYKIIAESVRI